MRDRVHSIGAIIAFLGISGFAEAITGRGSHEVSIAFFAVGLIMCLAGYTK